MEKHGLTMVETALRWLMHHSALRTKNGNDGVIFGCTSSAQLDANIKGCEGGPLPDEVVEALEKAWQVTQSDRVDYWQKKLGRSFRENPNFEVVLLTAFRVYVQHRASSVRKLILESSRVGYRTS